MPDLQPGHLEDSGTRFISHAIGASTSISVPSGSYGTYPIVIAIVGGQSGVPWPNTSHQLEIIANGNTYGVANGGENTGACIAANVIVLNVSSGPVTLDSGFDIRFRSPSATFNGVLAYAFFTVPVDFPNLLLVPDAHVIGVPDNPTAESQGGTIQLPLGSFHVSDQLGTAFTYGSQAAYGIHQVGGAPVFGTTATDWSAAPGWSNAARAIDTNGEVSIGFYNTANRFSIPWGYDDAPLSNVNASYISVVSHWLAGAGGPGGGRSFAQVVG